MGSIFAPVIGGYIAQVTSFREMCDIMALILFGFSIIFFLVNIGPKALFSCAPDETKKDGKLEEKDESLKVKNPQIGSEVSDRDWI